MRAPRPRQTGAPRALHERRHEPQVGGDAVAFGEQHGVAGDGAGGRDLRRDAVAHHRDTPRQQVAEPLGGVLSPLLLAKANTPLSTTTPKMATPSWGIPATKARQPATQNRRAKKWNISAARRRQAGSRPGAGNRFGPSRARRAAASPDVSPQGTDVLVSDGGAGLVATLPVHRRAPGTARALGGAGS